MNLNMAPTYLCPLQVCFHSNICLKEGKKVELLCTAEMEHGTDMKVEWTSEVTPPYVYMF